MEQDGGLRKLIFCFEGCKPLAGKHLSYHSSASPLPTSFALTSSMLADSPLVCCLTWHQSRMLYCTDLTFLAKGGWAGSWHNRNSCGRGEGRCCLIHERVSGCTTYRIMYTYRNSTVVQVLMSLVLSSSLSIISKEALKCHLLAFWNRSAGPHFVWNEISTRGWLVCPSFQLEQGKRLSLPV